MVRVAEGSATEDWKEKGLGVVAEVVVAGVRVEAELQARSPGCKRVLREEVQGRKSQKVQQTENIRLVTSSGWCSAKKGRDFDQLGKMAVSFVHLWAPSDYVLGGDNKITLSKPSSD